MRMGFPIGETHFPPLDHGTPEAMARYAKLSDLEAQLANLYGLLTEAEGESDAKTACDLMTQITALRNKITQFRAENGFPV